MPGAKLDPNSAGLLATPFAVATTVPNISVTVYCTGKFSSECTMQVNNPEDGLGKTETEVALIDGEPTDNAALWIRRMR